MKNLKKLYSFAIGMALIVLLTVFGGCNQPTASNPKPNPDPQPETETAIQFVNPGLFRISVYSAPDRQLDSKIADIEPRSNSNAIAWTPSPSGYSFYFSFTLYIGVVQILFTPGDDKGVTIARIDADKTTSIAIPTIENIYTDKTVFITNDVYLSIKNNGTSAFRLQKGDMVITRYDFPSDLVNVNETALYKFEAGSASAYSLLVNATNYPLPLTNFEAGHLYTMVYHGASLSLDNDKAMTIDNALSDGMGDLPVPSGLQAVKISSGVQISWNPVGGALYYEVYRGASASGVYSSISTNTITTTSYTDPNPNNAGINYYKVRAYSGDYRKSSNYSAHISFASFPPNAPGQPMVTIGNGYLAINWEAVAAASSYEIYVGTSDNTSLASKYGSDIEGETSAVVSGLTNETPYYVWIKAKNNAGTSGFSQGVSGVPDSLASAPAAPAIPTMQEWDSKLTLSWAPVETASAYEVWINTTNNSDGANKYGEDITGTAITVDSLVNGTRYYVWIKAKNRIGTSAFSPPVNGIPMIRTGLYKGALDTAHKVGNQNLTDALEYMSADAMSGTSYFIVLGADESISPSTLSYSGQTVNITLAGGEGSHTVSLSASAYGSLFTVGSGVTLVLDSGVTLKGRSSNTASLVRVDSGGTLTMKGNAVISGNTSSSDGGGVYVYRGTFTMEGGEISGNTASSGIGGGGVCLSDGTFTMKGGIISGNSASSYDRLYGGGVSVWGGSFVKTGGTIYGSNASTALKNTASGGSYYGDAVFVYISGTIKKRNTTAGESVNLNSGVADVAGGWE
ncbi:MAG: fibronectin type III domain-containing protein [Treponema sp.]|jgi:fibronectin type 3 domain-containing protein|nr:fibronectin type III domain-containing protein [Treponema sp.]